MTKESEHAYSKAFATLLGMPTIIALAILILTPNAERSLGQYGVVGLGCGWGCLAVVYGYTQRRGESKLLVRTKFLLAMAVAGLSVWALALALRVILTHGFTVNLDPEPGKTYHVSIVGLLMVWAL